MGYKALAQIALIIVSITLIFIYINPTFTKIGEIQDDIYKYNDAFAKAEEFNTELANLVRTERSYSLQDREALDLFLPDKVDPVQVMRDLEFLFEGSDVQIDSMSVADAFEPNKNVAFEGEVTEEAQLPYRDFSLSISGKYESTKKILSLIESNSYPLEIITMTLDHTTEDNSVTSGSSDELFKYELVLRVHYLSS